MSYSTDPMSSPERWHYNLQAYYVLEDQDVDFVELDSIVGSEVARNLDKNPTHAGADRQFQLGLENYDEMSFNMEISVSFVVRLWEDDENEIELILVSIDEELENVGIQVEERTFAGRSL